ncbi:uncharacterized protein MONOS_18672 [Monocercomonoides exilis]|uniref:uncharacterized protein n=1 Tax=Monocercomonoides exilis TaxID=2049356 RepID=UPI003559CEB9|nr:hypothetical protein MONOS_18672 [Monocercomonoides exilis]
MSTKEKTETCNTKKFTELFSQLSYSSDDEQREKIEEMNEVMGKMNKEEFMSVFTKDLSNRMKEMTDEKILSMENAILLLKHVGYWKVLKCIYDFEVSDIFLSDRFQEMIIDEEEKKEGKNEKLLVDLCECYLSLSDMTFFKIHSICIPCLLKVAMRKEENEEAQKEVEMALLALSVIDAYFPIYQELYLNELKEIVKYHQEHHNLTRIAYQSAWKFLIKRIIFAKSLVDVVVNELHFARESRRELEELTRYIDRKKEKEEDKKGKEVKEVHIIGGWLYMLKSFFLFFRLRKEGLLMPLSSVVHMYRAARENYGEISEQCISVIKTAAGNRDMKIYGLLKIGAIDAFLEEIQQPTLNDEVIFDCLNFFLNVSNRLKEKTDNEMEEAKRKATKRKVLEKMEEEGYEDFIIGFHKKLFYFNNDLYYQLSLNVSDYFVNV